MSFRCFSMLFATLLLGCGQFTVAIAPDAAVELPDDDCDTDVDADADGPGGDAEHDAGNDSDGDADGDVDVVDGSGDGPSCEPVEWWAVVVNDPVTRMPAHRLYGAPSVVVSWLDGPVVFELLAYDPVLSADVSVIIELEPGLVPGRYALSTGLSGPLSAELSATATSPTGIDCDATGAHSEASGQIEVSADASRLTFQFQFAGPDGCRVQIIDGQILI